MTWEGQEERDATKAAAARGERAATGRPAETFPLAAPPPCRARVAKGMGEAALPEPGQKKQARQLYEGEAALPEPGQKKQARQLYEGEAAL